MTSLSHPLPRITLDDKPFWEAAEQGELLQQRCADCGAFSEPFVEACYACHADPPHIEWAPVSGRGTLHTFNIYHRPYHPAFAEDVPYNTAMVELEEGPLLRTQIVDCPNEELRIGMPVEVAFEQIAEGATLPKFRPAEQQ